MDVQAILTVLASVCTAQVASRAPVLVGAASDVQKTPSSQDVTGHVSSEWDRLFRRHDPIECSAGLPKAVDQFLDGLLMLVQQFPSNSSIRELVHAAPVQHQGLSKLCNIPCIYHRCWSGGSGTGVKLCLCCGCSCGHGSATYGKYGRRCHTLCLADCCSEYLDQNSWTLIRLYQGKAWTWSSINSRPVMQAKLWTCCVSNDIPSEWCSCTNCPTVHAGAPAAGWHVPSCQQVLGSHLCACSGQHLCSTPLCARDPEVSCCPEQHATRQSDLFVTM